MSYLIGGPEGHGGWTPEHWGAGTPFEEEKPHVPVCGLQFPSAQRIALHRPDGKAVASPAGRTPQPQEHGGGGSRQNATDGGHLGWLPDPRVLTRQARSGSDRVPGESGAG